MEINAFLFELLLTLLGARLVGELAARAGVPAMIGEMLAGIVLGPSLLGWISADHMLHLMAEIGLILLLFEVGLDTNIASLMCQGKPSTIVAVTGFVAPLALGFALARWGFHQPLLESLFIGGALTATSIGVTMRVLRDMNLQYSRAACVVLGAAVLDDVFGVVLLALLFEFAGGGASLFNAGRVLLFVVLFLLLAPLAASLMGGLIGRLREHASIPGLTPTSAIILVLFFAWLAHVLGAPALLGGFAAGLALSRHFRLPFLPHLMAESSFVEAVETETKPVIHLFTPIFFVMVGASLNLGAVDWSSPSVWWMASALLGLAVVTKMAGALFIRAERSERLMIGLAMIPRAEVGLIFTELGRSSGVFNDELYAVMILVIAGTTVLPPLMMKRLPRPANESRPPEGGQARRNE